MDIVRRKLLLVTIGTERVKASGVGCKTFHMNVSYTWMTIKLLSIITLCASSIFGKNSAMVYCEIPFLFITKLCGRLQNSPYFCVFNYALAVNQKVRGWKRRTRLGRRFPFVSHALRRFARARLLRYPLPISLLILPTVLQSSCAVTDQNWNQSISPSIIMVT